MSDHVSRNRRHWDRIADDYQRAHGAQLSSGEPGWGAFQIPEREVGVLGDVRGLDVLELGCGAAQWSVKLARMGARVTGLDVSEGQLRHARDNCAGTDVRLVAGDAEALPFDAASFDLVLADHGAPNFTEAAPMLAEVARVLRPGGRFVFNTTTPFVEACWDGQSVSERLRNDYFGSGRYEDGEEVAFSRPYGEWIRLFRAAGLVLVDLVELRPGEGSRTTYANFAPLRWARRWPAEQIWVTQKP
ncbi:MAG: class I SAM-dependent methyltransferase [Myxococcota bacterium]